MMNFTRRFSVAKVAKVAKVVSQIKSNIPANQIPESIKPSEKTVDLLSNASKSFTTSKWLENSGNQFRQDVTGLTDKLRTGQEINKDDLDVAIKLASLPVVIPGVIGLVVSSVKTFQEEGDKIKKKSG